MRRFRLAVPLMTLFLLALPAPSGAVPLITESEPNDTSAAADALPAGECFAVGSGAVSPAGDDDFWSFSGSAGAAAWAYVDTGGTQNPGADSRDSFLTVFRPDGTSTIESDNEDGIGNGGDGTVESGAASAVAGAALTGDGTHFVRVMGNLDAGVIDPYRVFVAVSTGSPATETEPNDTSAQAQGITACPEVRSGSISGPTDTDWYAVSAAAGETIYVAGADTAGLVVSLRSGAAGGTVLMSGPITNFPDPPATAFSYNITAAGTYFVRIRAGDAGETGAYRLMVGHGPVAPPPPGPPGPGPGADSCAGKSADQVGTSGNDVMEGTAADETFISLGGNDKITGGGGDDTICAGPGKDTAQGQGGKDRLLGEGDGDTLKGGGGKDTLQGGGGKDRLAGQGGNDTLKGQGGRDRLNGGPGKDRCAQGGGTGPENCER